MSPSYPQYQHGKRLETMNAAPSNDTEFAKPERVQARKRLMKSLLVGAPNLVIPNVRQWVIRQGLGITNPEEAVEDLRSLGLIDIYQVEPTLGIVVKDVKRARLWMGHDERSGEYVSQSIRGPGSL